MKIVLILVISIFLNSYAFTQILTTELKKEINQEEALIAEKMVNDLAFKSGVSFKQGLFNMQENRRSFASKDFSNSIEVFLSSGVNVTRNRKLQNCYNQLIETIYRIEFPSAVQQPQIRQLTATCGWNWNENDYKTADAVAKLILATPMEKNSRSALNPNSKVAENSPLQGFNEQKFEVSPLDELAKLKVSDKELKYLLAPAHRIVRAKAGDTVDTLSKREGALAIEVAKYNGLLPTSVLESGREIKIPKPRINPVLAELGSKPKQSQDGKVQCVMDYFFETLNDPYSMKLVRWSEVEKVVYQNVSYWAVTVKFRAKNSFNAYILTEMTFYIQNNKVVRTGNKS